MASFALIILRAGAAVQSGGWRSGEPPQRAA